MTPEAALQQIRLQIDQTDHELLGLLLKRLQLVKQAAACKTHLTRAKDPDREAQIVAMAKQFAIENNMDSEFIASLYQQMLGYYAAEVAKEWKQLQENL